jgi:putative transposase
MPLLSYSGYRFPRDIIQRAVWLYLRFTLSYRDVEELLAERGIEISYETVRRWGLKFGPAFARNLRRLRPRPTGRWHLDEMVTLSAKSGCDQLQGRTARHTGPSAWTPLQPAHYP